jgi:cell division protein FtsB
VPKPANKNVRNMFASAQTGHLQSQLQERDDEIAALKDQIENLKNGALAETSGVQHYPFAFTRWSDPTPTIL